MTANPSDVIKQVLNQYGTDILLNGNRFCGFFNDLAPEMKIERRVLQRLNQESLLAEIYQLVSQEVKEKEHSKLELLLDEAGLSDTWKKLFFKCSLLQMKKKIAGRQHSQETAAQTEFNNDTCPDKGDLDPEFKEYIRQIVQSVFAIVIEESLRICTQWKHVTGMKLDRGFLSP